MEEIFKHNTFEIKEIVAECNRQLKIEGFEQSKLFILDSISNNDAGKENGKSVVEKYEKINNYNGYMPIHPHLLFILCHDKSSGHFLSSIRLGK